MASAEPSGRNDLRLTDEHRMLLRMRDTLYEGSWDDVAQDFPAKIAEAGSLNPSRELQPARGFGLGATLLRIRTIAQAEACGSGEWGLGKRATASAWMRRRNDRRGASTDVRCGLRKPCR